MIISRIIIFFLLTLCVSNVTAANSADDKLIMDNRIRTYTYNPNNVYLLVVHVGFQSSIEFARDEKVNKIIAGDSSPWTMTPIGNRLFIKTTDYNVQTNVTIITNKRIYHLDLVSAELKEGDTSNLIYVMRFIYPKNSKVKHV